MTLGRRRWNKASPEMPNWPLQSYKFFGFNVSFCSGRNYYTQRYCFASKIIPIVSDQLNLKQQYRKYKTKNRIMWQEITLQWIKSLGVLGPIMLHGISSVFYIRYPQITVTQLAWQQQEQMWRIQESFITGQERRLQ